MLVFVGIGRWNTGLDLLVFTVNGKCYSLGEVGDFTVKFVDTSRKGCGCYCDV